MSQHDVSLDILCIFNCLSVDELRFPDRQLNVASLNQVPFSPSVVEQCRFSVDESAHYPFRGEHVRVEQPDGGFALYHFKDCRTAFDWQKWVHQGPVLHKGTLFDAMV